MFEGDAELLRDFVVEANEGLAEIETDLLAIEAAGADIDSDLVNKVFRAIHSIKGAAGFLALKAVEQLSHSMENVLSLIRSRSLIPTGPIVDRLLKGADTLQKMIHDIENSNSYDVSEHVTILKAIAAGELPGETAAAPAAVVETIPAVAESAPAAVTLSVDPLIVAEHTGRGEFVFLTDWQPARDPQAKNPVELTKRLSDTGTVLGTTLPASPAVPCTENFQIVVATILSADQFSGFFEIPVECVTDYHPAAEPEQPASAAPIAVAEHVVAAPAVAAAPVVAAPAPATAVPAAEEAHHDKKPGTPAIVAETNIRVSVAVLDRLMNLAGELVLSRNQLLQTLETGDRRALATVGDRLDQVTTELQETIMQTRMQPVGNVLTRFTRVVRDMSKTLNKQAQLEIEGKDVELDKSIIEAIGDPLTHLVRNSMDHGLETPEARAKAGKNPTGTIRLEARHQEGKVLLVVADDGAGINPTKLKQKAVEKGVITSEDAMAMSDREAVNLIFAPGFSTAEKVTAVSGRGVGMDVVKTNFERLGGVVDVDSTVGVGTTITVRLPLTMAIIPSLIASCQGQRYAVPQGNIRELVRVRPDEYAEKIGRVNHAEVLRLRGTLLPLVRLSQVITPGAPAQTASTANTNIIVIETGRLQYGLVVDRLHDSEEIVVKPLGRHLKPIVFLAGATVLGDGQIALILDAAGIARKVALQCPEGNPAQHAATDQGREHNQEMIQSLVFSNHPSERFAVPMTVVARIERIHVDQIDSVAGQQVLQYRGGTLTLLSLDQCIKARPRDNQQRLYVVVFRHGKREIGLIAPEVLDIRNFPAEMDTVTFREPGVLGSQVVDGHTIRFLEVFDMGNTQHAIGKAAQPARTEPMAPASEATHRKPRIVYAEDSGFFRNKVKKFLETEGWDVVACEDGALAWDQFCRPDFEADLLITDVEMPNMNGFQLSEKVRGSQRFRQIPIIAVTSLAGDADRAHGIRVGVTEYMVKLNRDELLETVSRHLGLSLVHD